MGAEPRARRRLSLLLFLLGLSFAACAAPRPSDLAVEEAWIVAVKSCRLPESMPWYTRFAHHTWIDVKRGDEERWMRVEANGGTSGVQTDAIPAAAARADRRWGRAIRLRTTIRGERARRIAGTIEANARAHHEEYVHGYRAWPGPNSNTLIAVLAQEIPELRLDFDPNSLGKDYRGWASAGRTASKTGLRLDTIPFGIALGLREGVEAHFFGLTFGISLVPPRLNLPLLPAIPWEPSPPAEPDPEHAEADYEVQLEVAESAPPWGRRVVDAFARQGTIRFRAVGSEHWLWFTYDLRDPERGSSAALVCRLESHGPGAAKPWNMIAYFGDRGRVEILDRPCGELLADLVFVRERSGRFSGSLLLRKAGAPRPP